MISFFKSKGACSPAIKHLELQQTRYLTWQEVWEDRLCPDHHQKDHYNWRMWVLGLACWKYDAESRTKHTAMVAALNAFSSLQEPTPYLPEYQEKYKKYNQIILIFYPNAPTQ